MRVGNVVGDAVGADVEIGALRGEAFERGGGAVFLADGVARGGFGALQGGTGGL